MKKTVLLLIALFMLASSDLCSQTINSAEPQGRLIIRLVAPSLNLTQRDQIMQRIQARFGDVGGMFEQGSVNDTNNTYLTIVITPTRVSATTGSSSNNARSGRILSNTQDYLTMPFNASTNPNSFYDIMLSFKSGERGSRFISRSESHDFARYNSSSLSGLGRLEWSAMLSAVNGADQFIADAIYASFQQNMSVLSQSPGGNEE
ncbi:MAG: hypothetical protein HY22_08855 [[Candidatus Thermochlorobacteriaceae] bacterium GBChlB]|nr:MAG: hypothetical protein HY22_08855 [[Candidatus Thermochlorobacteriaceae] bacterium GBChlB]